jgi:hypothetical protein
MGVPRLTLEVGLGRSSFTGWIEMTFSVVDHLTPFFGYGGDMVSTGSW